MAPRGSRTGWHVEFYTDPRGRQPASDYLRSLSALERAIVAHELDLLRALRPGSPIPHARQIRGKLWELKLGDNRLFYCTYIGRRLVILHGYRKRSRKASVQEIAIAERRMAEFFEREAGKK